MSDLNDPKPEGVKPLLEDDDFNNQSIWKYVRSVCEADSSRLHTTALIDCTREYTYEQMFREWERYARVFSSLGITSANKSRVAIGGAISAEPLFAFYGLNITGAEASMFSYPDFLPGGQWKAMASTERITDLILSDILISPQVWPQILQAKAELGIRHVILLHSRLGGPCIGPAELIYNELNYHALRYLPDTVFMSDLLAMYAEAAIWYGPDDPRRIAVITHTSGTTKGTRKPLPYTNRSINVVATEKMRTAFFRPDPTHPSQQLRTTPSFDFSSFMCMCGAVNLNLTMGNTIVLTFFGFMHPKFVRAVEYYRLNVLFTSGFMIDTWMRRDDIDNLDFSSLKVLSCGGSYLPLEKLQKYEDFAHRHGYKGHIVRGYGMSETGGAQIRVPLGCKDDIIGYPEPEEDYLVYDEEDGQFHLASEGERTGILHITSSSMCLNTLDGQTLFEFTNIDGRDFVCTNDLVRVNPDGSLTYAGRADRYFANNEGVLFNPGIVEQKLLDQPQIHECAVAPVLDKRIHDTVPVLYVVPELEGAQAVESIRLALARVYLDDGLIATCNLPSQLVVVRSIPCNANGKIDIFRITRQRLEGQAYNIVPVKGHGGITDVRLERSAQLNSITGGTLPEGMGNGSALSIYDLFNSAPAIKVPALPPLPFWPK